MTEPGGYARVLAFAQERHRVYLRRVAGLPWPWTDDEILRTYRFCNIYRELDATTLWLRREWYDPHADDPDLWFAAAVARHANLPATLGAVGYPVPWRPLEFIKCVQDRMDDGLPAYSGAYVICAVGGEWPSKAHYLAEAVLGPLWGRRAEIRPTPGEPLSVLWSRLSASYGLGSFMAAQVVADAKFCGAMARAPDWWTFAAPGPGSQRGLNRVLGRAVSAPWRLDDWRRENEALRRHLDLALLEDPEFFPLSAQDCQNTLCEFDKYERVRLGQGRPKQLFRRTT